MVETEKTSLVIRKNKNVKTFYCQKYFQDIFQQLWYTVLYAIKYFRTVGNAILRVDDKCCEQLPYNWLVST